MPSVNNWELNALNTPFENKDKLKGRGYRWDVDAKPGIQR